jgi:hypothetical protein
VLSPSKKARVFTRFVEVAPSSKKRPQFMDKKNIKNNRNWFNHPAKPQLKSRSFYALFEGRAFLEERARKKSPPPQK